MTFLLFKSTQMVILSFSMYVCRPLAILLSELLQIVIICVSLPRTTLHVIPLVRVLLYAQFFFMNGTIMRHECKVFISEGFVLLTLISILEINIRYCIIILKVMGMNSLVRGLAKYISYSVYSFV